MKRVLLGVVLAVALSGCGGDGASTEVSAELSEQVAAVRAAADSGDADAALAALGDLSTVVERHRASGALSDERAAEIGAAMADVMRALPQVTAEATPVTEAPPEDDEGEGHGKKKGHDDD